MTTLQKTATILLTGLANLVFSPVIAQQSIASITKTYKLDIKRSKIGWKGPKSVGHKHKGYLFFSSGSLVETSSGRYVSASFVIDMNSILTTDDEKENERKRVDDMLKNDDFFSVKKFPIGKIVVKKIESTATPSNYKVSADLILKGISKAISFIATIRKSKANVTATANLSIDRKKWGINVKKTNDPFAYLKDQMIADEIPVELRLFFTRN